MENKLDKVKVSVTIDADIYALIDSRAEKNRTSFSFELNRNVRSKLVATNYNAFNWGWLAGVSFESEQFICDLIKTVTGKDAVIEDDADGKHLIVGRDETNHGEYVATITFQ